MCVKDSFLKMIVSATSDIIQDPMNHNEATWEGLSTPSFFFFPIEVISQIPAMIRKREGTSIVGEINTTESCMLHSGRMNHRNITCKTRKTHFAFLPKKNHKLFDHVSHKYKSSVVFIDA